MVVVACRNIGLELALNFILSRSSSNLAYSLLSVMVVKTFQRRMVRSPTQTIQPAIPVLRCLFKLIECLWGSQAL